MQITAPKYAWKALVSTNPDLTGNPAVNAAMHCASNLPNAPEGESVSIFVHGAHLDALRNAIVDAELSDQFTETDHLKKAGG